MARIHQGTQSTRARESYMTVKGGLHHLVDDFGEDAEIDAEYERAYVDHPIDEEERRVRHTTFCTPQQLARQREPRQGTPVALADQADVRPETLVGRPDGLCRQLCPGVD